MPTLAFASAARAAALQTEAVIRVEYGGVCVLDLDRLRGYRTRA